AQLLTEHNDRDFYIILGSIVHAAAIRHNHSELSATLPSVESVYPAKGNNPHFRKCFGPLGKSFRLLEKKYINNSKTQIAPRLDVPRKHKHNNQDSNTDQTASTSSENEAPCLSTEDMEGDWTEPRKTQKPPQNHAMDKHIEQTNKFEVLGLQPPVENNIQHDETQRGNRKSTHKPPPISVYNGSIKAIITILNKNEIEKEHIRLKQVYGVENTVNIQTDNMNNYDKTLKALKDEKIEFYTYTPKNTKIKSIVLKGVRGKGKYSNVRTAKGWDTQAPTVTSNSGVSNVAKTTPQANATLLKKQITICLNVQTVDKRDTRRATGDAPTLKTLQTW
ncbi:hypothetical protein PV326_010361, partial [Microctonus aethiopoides]